MRFFLSARDRKMTFDQQVLTLVKQLKQKYGGKVAVNLDKKSEDEFVITLRSPIMAEAYSVKRDKNGEIKYGRC